jgi:hypothetical protein
MNFEKEQKEICEKYNLNYFPSDSDFKIGISKMSKKV